MDLINILSLGAGVQSTTVALMSVEGELPKLDYAIFADTGWEPREVYDHLDKLTRVLEQAGVTVIRCENGNIRKNHERAYVQKENYGPQQGRCASMPLFTKNRKTEKLGMIRRQCTTEHKIVPIEKVIKRDILGIGFRKRWPKEPRVRQWFGISLDEMQRMRTSQRPAIINWYPLIERRMNRHNCLAWLERHGWSAVPRSACIGCPFKSNYEWRRLRDESPDEWADAVEFDEMIRERGGIRGDLFLHSSRVPLAEADLGDDPNQLRLWDDECAGMCGV